MPGLTSLSFVTGCAAVVVASDASAPELAASEVSRRSVVVEIVA